MHFPTPGFRFLLLPLGSALASLLSVLAEEPVLALATLPVPIVTTVGPIVPGTDTILSRLEELRREEEARHRALAMEFFSAIAENDKATLCRLLNDGIDPNVILPTPVPRDFVRRFSDELTAYYVGSEQGSPGSCSPH